MQDLTGKVTGSTLTAAEWNQLPNEAQNIITALGISLSSGDLNQLGKAVAGYVSNGDFYTDSGAVDAYVLTTVGSKQAPPAYADGMQVRFLVGNTNTGASTVNVAGLGVKSITQTDGSTLNGGELYVGAPVSLVFDSSNDRFEFSGSLGVGQAWQNVTGSRTAGVTYTNTTGRAISVSAQGQQANGIRIRLVIDSLVLDAAGNIVTAGDNEYAGVCGIVPPGSTYTVEVDDGTLAVWAELR